MPNNLSFKNISWLLASIAMVLAPHLLRLPPWASLLCVAVVLWRLYIAWHSLHLPPRWLLLMLSFTVVGGTFLNYGTIFARDSGVTLLALLTAMKLMEMYSQRDAMIVVFLGYFIVITNFLYSQTILTALYMLLAVLVITATLVGFNHTSERQKTIVQLRFASVLLVQSIPLMLILFVFFPRVQGPLWGLPQDTFSGISGLSNTMTPGSISQLILSDEVAFRVNFEGVIPKPDQLYWRGPVFWYFNGKNWLPGKKITRGSFKYERLEKRVQYTVTLEPHNNHWLFALDMPAMLPPESTGSNDYQVLSRTPVRSRMRYKMASYLSYKVGLDADEKELYRALQLPPDTNIGGNKRARALAASWRQDIDSEEAIMRKALSMFRNQKFHYTLLPPLLGDNQVDEFLFDTLQGFCEHYSSSFVFLMRSAGIPARVVTGYLGGQINLVGNYMIVRQSDAHAWAEVWLKDRGWVRADPTASVSPERINSGIAAAVPYSDQLPMMARTEFEWLRSMRMSMDAIANSWNQWILGYNPKRQVEFLSRVGMKTPGWKSMTIALIIGTGILMLILAVTMLLQLRYHTYDPVQEAYLKFCDKLAKKGIPRKPYEGARDYAERLAGLRPEFSQTTNAISELYIALRYGTLEEKEAVQELQRRVAEFRT
ncbi:MAG: DUF3488 and transglutaminase-like domain-containing protein [Nitrosomonadaceae bacterium]